MDPGLGGYSTILNMFYMIITYIAIFGLDCSEILNIG